MIYKIYYRDKFLEKAKKLFDKKPQLIPIYKDLLVILELDPYEESVQLQPLYDKLKEFHYINLTLNYKLILHIDDKNEKIYLIDIGARDTE